MKPSTGLLRLLFVQLAILPLDCDSGLPVGSSGDMWGGTACCINLVHVYIVVGHD